MILLVFLGVGSSSVYVARLNPASLAGSLAQTSDPAEHKGMLGTKACVSFLTNALAGYYSSELNFT